MKRAGAQVRFFSLAEAAAAAGGGFFPPSAAELELSSAFKVDSRQVVAGDVFVALKGERLDGHDFVAAAIERGASCVVVNGDFFRRERSSLELAGVTAIVIEDGESGLVALATEWLERISPQVVGITGSVGKTTTREMLRAALGNGLRIHAAIRSYNTLIGCSMTILGMPVDAEVLILELGTNRPGEIAELTEKFPVTHAVITEVAPAHLEGLKSLEGVLAAKMEIARSRRLEYLSYNYDNVALRTAIQSFASKRGGNKLRITGVGVGVDADIVISDVAQTLDVEGSARLSFSISAGDENVCCTAGIFGSQHAKNIAFAYAVARELDVPDDAFVSRMRGIELSPGRGRIHKTVSGGLVVDESYNANPNSVSMALRNLLEVELPEGFRRIAVLGGMRELGEESLRWHEVIMSRAGLFDDVYLIGPEWEAVQTRQPSLKGRYLDTARFVEAVGGSDFSRAVVLVKGSRYYELEGVLPLLVGGRRS